MAAGAGAKEARKRISRTGRPFEAPGANMRTILDRDNVRAVIQAIQRGQRRGTGRLDDGKGRAAMRGLYLLESSSCMTTF